jgi:hypothetical protein
MKLKAIIFFVVAIVAFGFSSCTKMEPLNAVNQDGNTISRAQGGNGTNGQSGNGNANSGGDTDRKDKVEEDITDPGGGDDDEKPASSSQ